MLTQLLANAVANGSVIALLALGLALIYYTTRVLHVAHAATFTLSAYCCYWLQVELKWPSFAAIAMTLAVSIALGMFYELLLYRPLWQRGASPLAALLASLGVYTVLINLVALRFGNDPKALRSGLDLTYEFAGITVARMQIVQLAVAAVLATALLVWLAYSQVGRTVRAVRDNSELAETGGVNLFRMRLMVLSLGSLLAGVAALLRAYDIGFDPLGGMGEFMLAVVAMVAGGVGSFSGCIAGAFLLSGMQAGVAWKLSSRWEDAVKFALLLLVLIFLPRGLFAPRQRLEEQEK